jgi:Tfp pilus assembly protein PilF
MRMGTHLDPELAEALAHHQAGRLTEAEQAYRAILARVPDEPRAQHYLGVIALQTGHLSEAEALLRQALEQLPDSAEIHSNLGLVLAATARIDEAFERFRRAIGLRPDYPEAHHNLGLAFEHKGTLEAALTSYARAVELKPDYGDALCHLAMALHVANRPDEAATFYRRALAAEPGLGRLWVYLAAALAASDDMSGAQEALDAARARKVDDKLVTLCQSLLSHNPGNIESELEILRQHDFVNTYVNGQPTDPIEVALREAFSAGTIFILTGRQAREARKSLPAKPAQPVTNAAEPSLTAYALHAAPASLIVAPSSREWMDRTPNRFAYRCLPMVIANQAGWFVLNPRGLAATWDGSDGFGGLHVEYLDETGPATGYSYFGSGILTWNVPYLFRTPPGYNLHVRGPANYPKDGVYPLEGVVETDWNDATFTMNWKLTRPHHRVVFEAGEPIAMVVPVKRGELETFRPEIRNITDEPQVELAYRKWSALRNEALRTKHDPNAPFHHAGWQRHYMLGFTVTMEPAPEHQTGLALREFADKRG